MNKFFKFVSDHPKSILFAILAVAALGIRTWKRLPVDVFPEINVPRVTIQTEAGGLTAEEVEQLVTIPIETAVNGIPGVSVIRSSSGGGLSFVWIDFDWNADVTRARFDVFERLARVRETLPPGIDCEISPLVSVTGEIMLVALTSPDNAASPLELRELAEFDLRTRLLAIPGVGEVAVMGGRLPEYRISVDPRRLAGLSLSLSDVIEGAKDTRTYASAGYLPDVGGEEIPLRQMARADSLATLRRACIPRSDGTSLRLGDAADITLAGAPRRGSASFNARNAVVLSVQKSPGGNTPELTQTLEQTLAEFSKTVAAKGIEVHSDAYRQADFINESIKGGGEVVRDAVIVVVAVLLITLLELRTLLVVLCTMPLSILLGVAVFPLCGIGVNVMTLGGFAVAAGDIVDGAIIFTEAVRRKRNIVEAMTSVAPGVMFSTAIVAVVFLPLMLLSGLEGKFFRPLALSYLSIFLMSLVAACIAVPALAKLFRLAGGKSDAAAAPEKISLGVRAMRSVYAPFLWFSLKFPRTVILLAVTAAAAAVWVAKDFGSSFLPPFREDAFNVMLSLPPGASLDETERVCEACVPALREIPGVKSVTRRTGRAERDQHAEPVSSSEYVVRVDMNADAESIKSEIRKRLGTIPGCSLLVGYPIAHRISAVLSGTEAELAVNVFGENIDVLRHLVTQMKDALLKIPEVSDVRANREVTVRSLRMDYEPDALAEAGLTLREAGEQVAAAFNGVEAGEVRDGLRKRSVVVRLADVEAGDVNAVKNLLLTSRNGRLVRLDDVAHVAPEEASNLMLREDGRRKAMISCNSAPGVDAGSLVEKLRSELTPLATAAGCTVSFSGSYQARAEAGRRLAVLGFAIVGVVLVMLVCALGSLRGALLTLCNVPLGLIGAVAAVAIASPVLSVSSLVGFVTVIGFVLRNGLLLLHSYRDRIALGADLESAIREGSKERMAPIVMTSLTTVFGLVPIMTASSKPGGELLAPLAVVQFGGLLGATILNLVILPAACKLFLRPVRTQSAAGKCIAAIAITALIFTGCRSYTPKPIDWQEEANGKAPVSVEFASADQVAQAALIGNAELNLLRMKYANSKRVAQNSGWWEDPELDFDALHFLKPGDNPFTAGASLGFTLPLSGVPGCEKKAAEFYADADAHEIKAAELETSASARIAAVKLAAMRERIKLLEDYDNDARVKQAFERAEKLSDAGEVAASDLAAARRRRHMRRHLLRTARDEARTQEFTLLKLLGFVSNTKLTLPPVGKHPAHGKMTRIPDSLALVQHPKVQAACARFSGSEAALEAEIRRQFPDLKLGPAYEREEGIDRLGLVAGLTLPLWNRNRKGIATAEGTRDESRANAINTWRDLMRDVAAAHENLKALMNHPPPPAADSTQADKLAEAGELNPIDYIALRDEICDFALEEAAWRSDVCVAEEELARFEPPAANDAN